MIREFRIHFELTFAYLLQFIRARLEYKADFLLGLFSGVLFNAVTLIFIDVLFAEQALTLNGWSKAQIFFIYGFSILSLDLFFAFFSNLYSVGSHYIIDGNLDRVLLRPLNSLYQVLLERVNIEDLLGIVIGGTIVYFASRQLGVVWTPGKVLLLAAMVLCGMMIYAGVFTALAALSFWFPDRMGLLPPVFNMIAFGKYPVTIYNPLLQFILKWIIPFAFVAFFPSTSFLGREEYRIYVLLTPVVATCTLSLGIYIWHLGVRRYESTGS